MSTCTQSGAVLNAEQGHHEIKNRLASHHPSFGLAVTFPSFDNSAGAEPAPMPEVAIGAQYDTTQVYVARSDVARFVKSFVATFGGQSTKQIVATVTPTPSRTTSQLVQAPVGTISVFGFETPVPYPFGAERNGYLVSDLDAALDAARRAGADVLVSAFSGLNLI